MNNTAPALEVRGLVAGYAHTTVLRDVSVSVGVGSVVALIGPNGAGKSTLLKSISGLVRPVSGSVRLFGVDVTTLPPNRRARLGMCHIPEGRGIYQHLTVRENIVMQAEKGREQTAIERATDAFPILGDRMHQRAGTLSGGERQMLSLARSYIRHHRLLMVDEASLGLAPVVIDEIFAFLERIVRDRGVSLLIVDQFAHRALDLASTAYVLDHGSITLSCTAAELRQSDLYATYLGSG